MYNLTFSCEKYIHREGEFTMNKDNVSFIPQQRPPKKEGSLFKYVITQKGFYILLLICIFAAGVSSFIISRKEVKLANSSSDGFELPPMEGMDIYKNSSGSGSRQNTYTSPESSTASGGSDNSLSVNKDVLYSSGADKSTGEAAAGGVAVSSAYSAVPLPTPTPVPNSEPVESTDDEQPINEFGVYELSVPVLGQKILDFYDKDLVYSRTFEDWRTHNGVDISGSIGTQVVSAGRGVVKAVYFDDMYGNTVEIDHGGGLVTKYCNLQSGILVKENDRVDRGEVIGGINNTAPAEISDPPHLHFEMLFDGVPVNPGNYIEF